MQTASKDNQTQKLSIGEAANYLGISIDTLRRWDKAGKVKSLRSPGGHRYFEKADLDQVFGKRYERYSSKQQPEITIDKDEKPPETVEETPVIETPTEKTPTMEAQLESVAETSPLPETPAAVGESPLPEIEVSTPEQKPLRSYAVVEQVDGPAPPPTTTFEHIQQTPEISTPSVTPQEPIATSPEPISQPSPALAPEESLAATNTETPPQPEVVNQENKKGSKMKPLLIFLAIFAIIDIILLIVYFVTSRPLLSPIS